jgi:hypothetical protein
MGAAAGRRERVRGCRRRAGDVVVVVVCGVEVGGENASMSCRRGRSGEGAGVAPAAVVVAGAGSAVAAGGRKSSERP